MSRPRHRLRRRAVPAVDIVSTMRDRILDGTLGPGQRLPTHVMIEREFRTTSPTVLKAMDILKVEGFVRSERRRGTFVAERPPHRHHYALALQFPQSASLSQFYVALRNEAARFNSGGRYFSIFYEIDQHAR